MASHKNNIGILILAAGASSRMGRAKQLLPWKDTTLLGNAIRIAKSSKAKSTYIVLGANAELIREKVVEPSVEVIENSNWESGLGSSIATGIAFLLNKDIEFDGILVMLADQPMIDIDYLNLMITSFYNRPESIIATAYKNRAGVPALFDKRYFSTLINLTEDFGAKAVIGENGNQVFSINPENKAADIDTRLEYDEFIKKLK